MKNTAETQTAICIAGAHRSGTSMLTRLLHACGLYLGRKDALMPPQADNPDGFWEHLGFVALNDELLSALGGAWDLPPKADENFTRAELDPLRMKARHLIEGFDSAHVWGWKDPRNSLTLPFWQDLLPGLKTLVAVRNPLEVAHSMRERNGTSHAFGLRLWEIYNRRVIEAANEPDRLVTHYDLFFENPKKELQRIADFIELPDAKISAAAKLVTTRRRHTHFTVEQLIDARVSEELIELYRALIAESSAGRKAPAAKLAQPKSDDAELLPGSVSRINTFVPERIVQIEHLYGELLARTEARHKAEIEKISDHLTHSEERRKEQVEELTTHLAKTQAAHKAQVEELTTHLAKTERQYKAQIDEISTHYTGEIARHNEEIQQLRDRITQRSISLAQSETRAQDLQNRLRRQLQATKRLSRILDDTNNAARRLRSSLRWQIGNPIAALKAKLSPEKSKHLLGYGHLEKAVSGYEKWRIDHPEIATIDDEIRGLVSGSESAPPRDSAAGATPATAAFEPPVPTRPFEFPVFDKVEANSIQSEYPDVAAANVEPLTHSVSRARTEERKTTEEAISFETYRPAFDIPREPTVSAEPSLVSTVKAIAFYLPQFHPIPENDRWWGEGFTEWNNVRAGRPNFPGHYQPHVPTGLGYYDLRETEVLQKQTELAKAYGIYGFSFYYYWFGGKVLLDLPIRRMLESGKPDFPFCICWANENWTRRWDGLEDDVLIAQSYSPEDDVNFIRRLENVLLQKNYIRVRGKPLLLVYRPSLFPDSLQTTERWRDYFRRKGHGELHLVMVRSFYDQTAPEVYGFDAAVQFPPHFPTAPITSLFAGKEKFEGTIHDYTELRRAALEQLITASSTGKTYAAVMPSWDNTARRGSHAVIWANSSPESYYEWLSATVDWVRKKAGPDERLIFINAWNEWAEGCHLEPDEKYGHAWLNATALALRPPARPLPSTSLAETHPEPPRTETIKVPALRDRLRLVISVLFYHREDLIERFLQSILRQILKAQSQGDIECSLSLSFNYQPDAAVIAQIHQIIATTSRLRADAVHILENGFNVGFGAGHNMVFDKFDSDIFLIMNSDVRVIGEDYLVKLVDRFRGSDAAIVGLSETASRLREDGCGIPIKGPEEEFDFVDGSALAVRSDLARRFGLFSPSYDYFYFEDVDLCLRYRQMGLQIALLDAPYEHERSSSSRLLPQFAVENILDRNRARLFEKWGKYLRTRTLSNRIGVRFLEIDRQLQCASLPALFGLLAEHSTAVIDLWGVHEQLGELFLHPRIRLIPSWQTLQEDDYLRHYDLATNQAETPRVYDIANRMGCDPDFEGAKGHLESLIGSACSENSKPSKTALLYVARKSPLFDGKEPNAESFAPVAKMLREKNFSVRFYTDYGTFEIQNFNDYGTSNWKHVALCPGMELLEEIASADLIVASDDWIAELSQLLQKRTFLWLGATSARATIWDFERASCFTDPSLPCLGCYHQFGRNCHNVCLRGDIACMRPQLAKDFVASLETFLGGEPLKAVTIHPDRLDLTSHRTMPSTELSLEEYWPSSTANSVLVLTPVNPQLEEGVLERAKKLAHRALQGMRNCRVVHDNCGEAPVRGQPHPHRQAAMASLRQHMVERYLQDERWIFWVDADIIDYPPFLIEQLVQRAEGGIAAPLVLMEGEITEPVNKDGFGPGRFFDIAGFVENGRWARFTAPYFDQPGPIYRLDSVGSCYLVNADLYRMGAAHAIDPASETFLKTKETWPPDAVARNQRGPANAYTEHYSVCQFAIRHGLPVQAFADLVASHQKV